MGSEGKQHMEVMKVHEAASGNHLTVLKQAFEGEHGEIAKADLELALLVAAKNGHNACVEFLLGKEVNILARDGQDNTPLVLAAEGGHTDVVKTVLKHGCPIDCCNSLGYNALMKACEKGHLNVVELLIQNGADSETLVDSQSELGLPNGNYNYVNYTRNQLSPLMIVVQKQPPSYIEIIKTLLRRKSAVKETNLDQCTALHIAAKTCDSVVIEMLLNAGAEVNTKDYWGMTPLLGAVSYNKTENTEVLLEHGADVHVTDSANRSPLSFAASRGFSVQLVEMLLLAGANIDHLDAHRNTPLFCAIGFGKHDIAKCLIQHGCNLTLSGRHMTTRKVMTCLQRAVWQKDAQMIEILYRAGAFTNQDLYDVYNDSTYSNHCEDEPAVWEYLDWLVRKPRPLVSSCRLVILKSLRRPLLDSVEVLNLPSSLKEYLKFSDVIL